MSLKVELNQNVNEKIYPPYLEIEYEEQQTIADVNSDGQSHAAITFTSESFMDMQGYLSL